MADPSDERTDDLASSDKTWLGFGHTYRFGKDAEFAEGIDFCSVMLAHSMELSEDFTHIELEDDEFVTIYSLIPLYKEELEFKLQNGATALLERFDEYGVEEIITVGRPNVCG